MSLQTVDVPRRKENLAVRLWTYQRERFPLVAHGAVIAALSISAPGVSSLLTGRAGQAGWAGMATAFVTLFVFFLQLRIADEFKDREDDLRYRPWRPVPRGLVSLGELAAIGIAGAVLQIGLAMWLDARLVWLLLAAWVWFGLMSAEFFAKAWLKARPIIYLASHMVILPLIVLYATACDWLVAGVAIPPAGLAGFLLMCMANGVVFEIGRKIRAPEGEQVGVETYSALWGPAQAVLVWLAAILLAGAAGVHVAAAFGFAVPFAAIATGLLAIAALVAIRFHQARNIKAAKTVETVSGLWNLSMLLALGVLPMVFQ
jgi:4-hydroxybenzoate polyprenyltransferase